MFGYGTVMTQEPGNMVGPTIGGIEDLIAQDPNAYWDDATETVKTDLGRSPRIFPIPLYDPDLYDQGKINGRNATLVMRNWIGFFVEDAVGNEVYGRITAGGSSVGDAATVSVACGGKSYPAQPTDKSGSYHIVVGATGKCTLTVTYKGLSAEVPIVSYETESQVDLVLETKDGKLTARRK